MLLRDLIHDLPELSDPASLGPGLDVDVASIDLDSRAVGTGSLFCCIRGAHADGHEHARDAVEHGAVAVLAEDSIVMAKSGRVLTAGDLAAEYGFTDVDGRRWPAFRMEG